MGVAIITGASSGIGREFAIQLDKRESVDELWLIGRDADRLNETAARLSKSSRIFAINLSDGPQLKIVGDEFKKNNVEFLVNSAGFGLNGDFTELNMENQLDMIDLNCRAIVDLTHRVLPFIKKGGAVINISSIAGFSPLGAFAIYGATKSFLNSFSIALTAELKVEGMRVLTVTPGSVDTNFSKRSRGNSGREKKMFSNKATANDIVTKALKDLDRGRVISAFGTTAKLSRVARKLLSPFFVAKLAYTKIYPKN
jgi:short-subunit dehydrogenase